MVAFEIFDVEVTGAWLAGFGAMLAGVGSFLAGLMAWRTGRRKERQDDAERKAGSGDS